MTEATALPDRQPDSGQFVFNPNEFVGVKVPFTDVFLEDDFMAGQVLSTIPDRMTRAFEEYLETQVLKLQNQQTLGDPNAINGAKHRFSANGTSKRITIQDVAYVNYALKKASAGNNIMIGIVDPSFEFETNISAQVTTSFNPMYEGVITTGIGTGFRFIRNIYGVDFYTSNYLDEQTAAETLVDYGGNATNGAAGDKLNVFFSAQDRANLPFIGSWRRRPKVESWRDPSKETEYHQFSARFGLALHRPETLVVMNSGTTLTIA